MNDGILGIGDGDDGSLPMGKADLVIRPDNFTITARDLGSVIAASGQVFDRGGPVQVLEQAEGPPKVARLSADRTVILAHKLARPVALHSDGNAKAQTLPERVARLYLADEHPELAPLRGVTGAPLLADDGSIRSVPGYDHASAIWCASPQAIDVPARPSREQALAALLVLRQAFGTFPFADASTVSCDGLRVVDTASPPGQDESAFLVGLLTAICRASLPLVPGVLIAAPQLSGAGTGKGKLVRSISLVAYGVEPHPFPPGRDRNELEKRIASALLDAVQVLFIDNANGEAMSNDLLASILTESSVGIRPLGSSRLIRLNPKVFVAITGNGVSLSEDLARRFVSVNLDAGVEDPEARPFPPGFLPVIAARRSELLATALTIWRWGRHQGAALPHGRAFGSFEEWGRWVRDPLLALGCVDPVVRSGTAKTNDPLRRAMAELYGAWWKLYADRPVTAANLVDEIQELIDPQGRGRQFIASFLASHVGTRANGFTLIAQKGGKWGATTYALVREVDEPMVPMPARVLALTPIKR